MRNPIRKSSIGLVFAGLLLTQPAWAQDSSNPELKKEIQALSDAVKAVQRDVQEIKTLLLQRGGQPPAPQNFVLDLANRPSKGRANAKLTMVEFSDFQCPFCERHVRDTDPQLAKEYLDTGKLKVVFMDFPLEAIHTFAFKAAETARCAGEQGKFWEMHDRLFSSQKTPTAFSNWTAHAAALRLKIPEFENCLSSGKYAAEIRRDVAQGVAAGVSGTPGFFLAVTDPEQYQGQNRALYKRCTTLSDVQGTNRRVVDGRHRQERTLSSLYAHSWYEWNRHVHVPGIQWDRLLQHHDDLGLPELYLTGRCLPAAS